MIYYLSSENNAGTKATWYNFDMKYQVSMRRYIGGHVLIAMLLFANKTIALPPLNAIWNERIDGFSCFRRCT